jgi:hypothetical protein
MNDAVTDRSGLLSLDDVAKFSEGLRASVEGIGASRGPERVSSQLNSSREGERQAKHPWCVRR